MMERKQSAARAAALALAERAARMAQRERSIAEELAGFLGAREHVSVILEHAQRRCEAIMARARRRAAASQGQAEAHVVELVALIGDRQEVAEHTGLSLREIRRALREAQEEGEGEGEEAASAGSAQETARKEQPAGDESSGEELGGTRAGVEEPGAVEVESAPAPADSDTNRVPSVVGGDQDGTASWVSESAVDETPKESRAAEASPVEGTDGADSRAAEELGQVAELSGEESASDRAEPNPASQGPQPQEWAALSPIPGQEAMCEPEVAVEGDTHADTSHATATSAGDVGADDLETPAAWSAAPVDERDVPSPEASPGRYTGMSAGLDPLLLADVARGESIEEDTEPIAGWQESPGESWWSSSPDSAA